MMRPVLFCGWLLLAGVLPLGVVIWCNWMIAPAECWAHIIDGRALLPWGAWFGLALQVGERGILD